MPLKTVKLYELLRSYFGVATSSQESDPTLTVGTSVSQILPNNPNRLGLLFVNNGTSTVFLKTRNTVALNSGIYLYPGGGAFSLRWDIDFELVASSWYGICALANNSIYTLEIISTPTES